MIIFFLSATDVKIIMSWLCYVTILLLSLPVFCRSHRNIINQQQNKYIMFDLAGSRAICIPTSSLII